MKTIRSLFLPLSVLILMVLGCSKTQIEPAKALQKLFPPEEACLYPSFSSIQKFRPLGVGQWQEFIVGGDSLGYYCGKGETNVNLDSSVDRLDTAQVEYGVSGNRFGATSIGFDYDIFVESPLKNEPSLRNEFVVLLGEVCERALKQHLPAAVKTNILDLNTYELPGTSEGWEEFQVGDGLIRLGRTANPERTKVLVKILICADKNGECK